MQINHYKHYKLKEKIKAEGLIPNPFKVGEFTKEDININDHMRFLYPNTWVFHGDVVNKVLSGNYSAITPFCSEFVPTMNCSNRCRMCGYKSVKKLDGSWKRNDFLNPRIHMQDIGFAKSLLDKLIDGGVKGIIFTGGGDPVLFSGLEKLMAHATERKVDSVLYTNGNSLSINRIDEIIRTKPLLVRVSLNTGTEEIYNKFHCPLNKQTAFQGTLKTIEEFARGAIDNPLMSVGVGFVINEINRHDLIETALRIKEIKEKVGGGIEFVTYRPAVDYYNSQQLPTELLDETCKIVETKVSEVLCGTGIRVRNLEMRYKALKQNDKNYTEFKETGIFGELGPNGKMYLCCDRNTNPYYEIGDLTKNSLLDIYSGKQRKNLLDEINRGKCERCPPACKSHEVNKQFEDIERFRKAGELYIVKVWIEMQKEMPRPKMINF